MQPNARHLNPKKLLLGKWTAVTPDGKEKHFIVTKLIEPEPPNTRIEQIVLEAIYTRREIIMPWIELNDVDRWLQGWR